MYQFSHNAYCIASKTDERTDRETDDIIMRRAYMM